MGPLALSFLLPLVAVGCGGATAYTALRNQDAAQALGRKRIPTIVLGGLAIVLAPGGLDRQRLIAEGPGIIPNRMAIDCTNPVRAAVGRRSCAGGGSTNEARRHDARRVCVRR